ncbi:MAG: tetratricopeptide repeat protein [Bdellovibrio sp.]|nr:tetratricopeptide repeat protein [Methylotenera sp.]
MTIRNYSLSKRLIQLVFAITFASANAFADELKDISQMADNGQQAAALERINTYLAANPKDAQAMFMKGIILAESNKREEAIKAFTDLTEKYPNLPEPYNNLAVLYADAGQYDKAKNALETAIKTHPSYATAHENLGDIYARMASEAYDKALQLDSGNSRAQSKLAMIKDLFGNKTNMASKAVDTSKTIKTADASKPSKTATMPIRAVDKKVETVRAADTKMAEAEKPMADAGSGDEKVIIEAVNNWAKAWSAKDLDKYFNSYADSFRPAKGESHKAWEQTRRERISRPSSIGVDVANPKVTFEGADNAKVSFKQSYRADGKPIRTDKTLAMKKVGGVWLIDQEIASN